MEMGELGLQALSRQRKRYREGQQRLSGIWNSFRTRKK